MVELIALVVVWGVLNVAEKLYTPGERGDLIVWAVAVAFLVVPIWLAIKLGG